jgi:hypothetical protein
MVSWMLSVGRAGNVVVVEMTRVLCLEYFSVIFWPITIEEVMIGSRKVFLEV